MSLPQAPPGHAWHYVTPRMVRSKAPHRIRGYETGTPGLAVTPEFNYSFNYSGKWEYTGKWHVTQVGLGATIKGPFDTFREAQDWANILYGVTDWTTVHHLRDTDYEEFRRVFGLVVRLWEKYYPDPDSEGDIRATLSDIAAEHGFEIDFTYWPEYQLICPCGDVLEPDGQCQRGHKLSLEALL